MHFRKTRTATSGRVPLSPLLRSGRKPLKRLLLLTLLAGLGLLFAAGPAAAAKPCWKKLIDDWYDGRIDKVYPVACYRQAMKHAGEDVKVYSSLPEDLTRALQSAITKKGDKVVPPGGRGRQNARSTSSRGRRPDVTNKAASKTAKTSTTTTTPTTTTTTTAEPQQKKKALPSVPLPGRQPPKGFFPRLLDFLGPNNADSIPLPLLFLAGLALVLTAAGAAGMVTRRLHARRAGGGGPGVGGPPPPSPPLP